MRDTLPGGTPVERPGAHRCRVDERPPSPRSLRSRHAVGRRSGRGRGRRGVADRVGGDDGVGARHREHIGGGREEPVEDAGAGLGGAQQIGVRGRERVDRRSPGRRSCRRRSRRCDGPDRRGRARRGRTAPAGRPPVGSVRRRWRHADRRVHRWCRSRCRGDGDRLRPRRPARRRSGRRRPGGGNHGSPVPASITEPDELTTASAATVIVRPIDRRRRSTPCRPRPACRRAGAGAGADDAAATRRCARRRRGAGHRTRPSAGCRSGRPGRGRRSPPPVPPARRGPDRGRPEHRAGAAPGGPSPRRRQPVRRRYRPTGTRHGCGRPDCGHRERRSRVSRDRHRARRPRRPRRHGASTTVVPVCQPRPTR